MKNFILLFSLVFLIFSCSGKNGTNGSNGTSGPMGPSGPSGTGGITYITANTVWSSDQVLTGDVIIDQGVTLTIQPGVTISLYPGVKIDCFGKILAMGNSGSKILFTKAFNLTPGGVYNEFESTNIFSYCVFKSSGPVYCGFNNMNYLKMNNCDFKSNSGSIITGSAPKGFTMVSNCYIAYNDGAVSFTLSITTNDSGSPQQYSSVTGGPKAPRSTPVFP